MKKNNLYRAIALTILFCANYISFAQQGNIWTFGAGALIDFNGPPTAGTSAISTFEGCTSIANNNGNLLFYTDGINIWDGNHTLVITGLLGHSSAAQSGIVIPVPGSATNYFIVSIPQRAQERARYTEIMVNGGVVSVVGAPNNTLPDHINAGFTTEGMTVAAHCNGEDYWLITHEMGNNRFKAYQVTDNGFPNTITGPNGPTLLPNPVVSNVGPSVTSVSGSDPNVNAAGCMKISLSNTRLAMAIRQVGVGLFDFDPNTGTISNYLAVPTANPTFSKYYGIEFSPNSDILYYTDLAGGLYSYDIIGNNLNTLANTVGVYNNLYGALQLAPDNQIYMARDGDANMNNLNQNSLGVISNPNNFGGATFNANGFLLAPGTACKAGLPNIVPTLTSPTLTVSGEVKICSGESSILTASGGTTYSWSPSVTFNTPDGASVTVNPTSTQTYTVSSTTTNGCIATEQITVTVENCCPLVNNPPAEIVYHNNPNEIINADTYWTGTHYFDNGIVVTVENNAVLDITNVDLVFEECAGIDFTDGAELRSNNSVYRTCDPEHTWRGLHFYNAGSNQPNYSSGIINECTFKNAQRAIYMFGQNEYDFRATNNLFSSCKAGIVMENGAENSVFIRSLTGNTFLLDNLSPDFDIVGSCEWGVGGYRAGIVATGINFLGDISQNDFITQDESISNFYGIDSKLCDNIVVSSNNFTDLYRSVSLFRNTNSVIESNEILVGNALNGYQHQIAATSCNNTLIVSNELKNTNNQGDPVNNSAIYCSLGSSYDIKENNIEGFDTGIQCENASNVYITENTITDGRFYGVYVNKLEASNIFCNSINMDAVNGSNVIGIGYFETVNGNHQVEIGSNCIFETNTAIHIESTATNTAMPKIQNNFLYNYSDAGIEIINVLGNIGSSPSPALGAGRNSFVSNNGLGLTGDIITNAPPLISYGNFGVSFVPVGVSIMGNNVNSTASCGLQIDLANSSNGNVEVCDDMADAALALVLQNNNLAPAFESKIADYSIEEIIYAMNRVQLGPDSNAVNLLYEAANKRLNLSGNDGKWLEYNYLLLIKEFSRAKEVLEATEAIDQDESDLLFIEKRLLDLNENSNTVLSPSEIEILEFIGSNDGNYAHMAIAILNKKHLVDQLEFYPTKVANHVEVGELVDVNNVNFVVYPNPAEEMVNFEYNVSEDDVSILKVYDLTGRLVETLDLQFQYSVQTIDVSDYPKGVYTLTIVSNDNIVAHSKLIKQ